MTDLLPFLTPEPTTRTCVANLVGWCEVIGSTKTRREKKTWVALPAPRPSTFLYLMDLLYGLVTKAISRNHAAVRSLFTAVIYCEKFSEALALSKHWLIHSMLLVYGFVWYVHRPPRPQQSNPWSGQSHLRGTIDQPALLPFCAFPFYSSTTGTRRPCTRYQVCGCGRITVELDTRYWSETGQYLACITMIDEYRELLYYNSPPFYSTTRYSLTSSFFHTWLVLPALCLQKESRFSPLNCSITLRSDTAPRTCGVDEVAWGISTNNTGIESCCRPTW